MPPRLARLGLQRLAHHRHQARIPTTTKSVPFLARCGPQQQQQQVRWHGGPSVDISSNAPTVSISFHQVDDSIKTVDAKVGESLLQTAHRHDIDLEGACEGVCACSTCHLIFPVDVYDALPEPSEDEEDMLDMAFGLTETSRLGCQVIVTQEMDGITVEMPKATRNFYVDGHVPKPH